MPAMINSWTVGEWARLTQVAQCGKKALERDLADTLVAYMNSHFRLSLAWVCSPDETDRNGPAPDCLFRDEANSVSAALEVKRLYDHGSKKSGEAWRRFASRVARELSSSVDDSYYYLAIAGGVRAPAARDACNAVKDVTARLTEMEPGQGGSLSSLLGGDVRARRLETPCHGVVVEAVALGSAATFSDKYVENLRKGSRKLRTWRKAGCETFLLYDARMLDALLPSEVRQFAKWHKIARSYETHGLGDPRSDGPCPFVCADFADIDHILVFGLDSSGVVATMLWKHERCGLAMTWPDEWGITPPGWHDDVA